MKDVARALALTLLLPALSGAQAPPKPAPNQPITAAYYYRVKWGFQEEFERLFLKNHYPVLEAQLKPGGRLRSVALYRPMYHGDGRADLVLASVPGATGASSSSSCPSSEGERQMSPPFAVRITAYRPDPG